MGGDRHHLAAQLIEPREIRHVGQYDGGTGAVRQEFRDWHHRHQHLEVLAIQGYR